MARNVTTARSARLAAAVSSVLSSGVLFGTVASLTPGKAGFDSRTYVTVQQATIRALRPVMGVLLPTSMITNMVVLTGTDKETRAARRNAWVGFLGPLVALVLTARYELPINSRVMSWDAAHPPTDWTGERDRWERVHLMRTAAALAGVAGTLAGHR